VVLASFVLCPESEITVFSHKLVEYFQKLFLQYFLITHHIIRTKM